MHVRWRFSLFQRKWLHESREKLLQIYHDVCNEDAETITKHFVSTMTTTDREKCMFGYIRLIVLQSLPIWLVEKKEFRDMSKFDVVFSRKKITKVLLSLLEVVGWRISKELSVTKGALMHDIWSRNITHYLGIIAVYMRKSCVMKRTMIKSEYVLAMPLLSASPMASSLSKNESDAEIFAEATEFNAEANVRHMEDVFQTLRC